MMISLPKIAALIAILLSFSTIGEEAADLPKNIHLKIPLQTGVKLGDTVQEAYSEILAGLGVKVEFSNCVPTTCAHSVLMGEADGEGGRVAGYKLLHPTLILVEEPILKLHITAFSINENIKISSWADFKDTEYTVAHQRGYYYPAQKLAALMNPSNIILTNSSEEAFAKLLNKEIDVYVGAEATMLKLSGKNNSAVKRLCLLDAVNIYPYLHPKHQRLADALALGIQAYKKSGKFEDTF